MRKSNILSKDLIESVVGVFHCGCEHSELKRPVEIAEVGVQPEAGTFGTFINRLRP